MRAHKIATASMLVLAVSGWGVAAGSGAAYAETGPGHGGKGKARAEGGSTTGGDVFQQNIAQSARQNNNCNNPNSGADADETVLTDSRWRGRCVTADGSLTAFSRIYNGPAHARGGSSSTLAAEQTIAQWGRQNNNCNNPNNAPIDLHNSRLEGLCTDQDHSITHTTVIKGGGARAHGGSGGAGNTDFVGVGQQNIAQVGRQNNNCNNPQRGFEFTDPVIDLADSQVKLRCGNKDASFTKGTLIKSGGARAHGGSGQGGNASSFVDQQNMAQEGRQNNNCVNLGSDSELEDTGRLTAHCENKDASFTQHARINASGARAHGGNATGAAGDTVQVGQQNIAQEGRQNNNCTNAEEGADILLGSGGSQLTIRCRNQDASFSKHSRIKSGGAHASGGSGSDVEQQNMAQEGRQNNTCNNPNSDSGIDLSEGDRVESRCGNKDHSFNKHTSVKSGGARAGGGSGAASEVDVEQQNIAQEGRQNNTCTNQNADSDLFLDDDDRVVFRCGNKDHSFSKHTSVKSGGARAGGGSTTGVDADVQQQNIAQEGRQNNTCHNPNNSSDLDLDDDDRVVFRCGNKDHSVSKHTSVKGGGARAGGGSTTGGSIDVEQQNIAQEGRQNNTCHNPNDNSDLDLDDDDRVVFRCGNIDGSFSKHTFVEGGGARTRGGGGTNATVEQQNIAQEGRQNNTCHNPNNDTALTLDDDDRVSGHCGNKDVSFSRHTSVKGGGARASGGSGADVEVSQQNIAQEGRQNNSCHNPNADADIDLSEGGRLESRCGNTDASFSKHTSVKGAGARALGGSTAAEVETQNTAQEGRQNNTCTNINDFDDETIEVTGGRLASRCGNKDTSFNHTTTVKGGGARAGGGNATGDNVDFGQQNIAQEGRQNNACTNINQDADVNVGTGGQATMRCHNKDASVNHKTTVKGGGARAEGSDSPGDGIEVGQQNIAQEGRQNNTCAGINGELTDTALDVGDGQAKVGCENKDRSLNHKTFIKGGGARANGGSTTGEDIEAFQQNIAQEGRQNLACGNSNHTDIDLTDNSRYKVNCKQTDHSTNAHTKTIGGGARATGGSATADLFQQNTAQEGRQNTRCGNTNNLTLTATGSSSKAQCIAVDRSTNIG
ncbi:hypothetical protein [Streptomyces sp. NPDC051776]|uniref:hypothetical protein n=1 Tax=Streptomyces sp. NPDC051776 TaxID=3155414 RepID=UPI003424AF97